MRYRVLHRTEYRYGESVDLAYHTLHVTPRATATQTVASAGIVCAPEPSSRATHIDHFGNRVVVFALDDPHDRLVIQAESEVALHPTAPPASTPAWEAVRDALDGGGWPAQPDIVEFALPSPLVPPLLALADLARPSFPPGRPVLEAALDLMHRVAAGFAYDSTATTVATPLWSVLAARRGVCQDYAHVTIGALRSMGLAARYVSGYLHTRGVESGQPSLLGADASHAWVAVWCGAESGWVQLDPTNDTLVADEHVVLAWGRDFADVSPVRGVILGGGYHEPDVAVSVRRLP